MKPLGNTHRVHKEDLEVLVLRPQISAPWNLALFDHLHGIDVDEPRSGGQQEHSFARKQALALVHKPLLEDHLAVGKHVPLVSLLLLKALQLLGIA